MRTDVKVGLFVGIVALVLAGWFFWPRSAARKPMSVVTIGGRDAVTADRPVLRPGQNSGSSLEFSVPPPPATTDTSALPPGFTPAAPVPPAGGIAAAPVEPAPGAGAAPAPEPTIPSSTARQATGQATGPAAIGREPLIHVVRAGDTLEKVAQTYYGNTSLAGGLRQANPQLTGGKSLRAGAKIKVPAEADLPRLTQASVSPASDAPLAVHVDTGAKALAATPSTQPAGAVALGPQDYKVQKGDTLYSIALKQLGSGKRWHELLDMNTQILGGKPTGLRPGMILRLAAAGAMTSLR
jgi:LysM repeat protein